MQNTLVTFQRTSSLNLHETSDDPANQWMRKGAVVSLIDIVDGGCVTVVERDGLTAASGGSEMSEAFISASETKTKFSDSEVSEETPGSY